MVLGTKDDFYSGTQTHIIDCLYVLDKDVRNRLRGHRSAQQLHTPPLSLQQAMLTNEALWALTLGIVFGVWDTAHLVGI